MYPKFPLAGSHANPSIAAIVRSFLLSFGSVVTYPPSDSGFKKSVVGHFVFVPFAGYSPFSLTYPAIAVEICWSDDTLAESLADA